MQAGANRLSNNQPSASARAWRMGVLGIALALLGRVDLGYFGETGALPIFRPEAGIALAAVLLGGEAYAVPVVLGGLAAQIWIGREPLAALALALCGGLEAWIGVRLLARPPRLDPSLTGSTDYLLLVGRGALLAPLCVAPLAAGACWSTGISGAGITHDALDAWMGDALGILAVLPLALAWHRAEPPASERGFEAALILAAGTLAGQVVFLGWLQGALGPLARGYWMFLFVTWAAARLGLRGVTVLALVFALQARLGVLLQTGFFAGDLMQRNLVNFWAYNVILLTVSAGMAIVLQERGRMAAQLESSLGQYRSLFDNLREGLSHTRMLLRDGKAVDYEFLAVNPNFAAVTGLHDVVGRRISQVVPGYEESGRRTLEHLGRVATTGEPARWTGYFPPTQRWFAFSAYRAAPGEVVTIVDDVSARVRAEEQLRKLSLAVEQSPASIVITDVAGNIEYVNSAFTQVSGYALDEVLGRNPRLLQSGITPRASYEAMWQAIRAGEVWRGEFVNRRKDGAPFVENAVISALRQEDGRITHFIAVKEDVTAQRRNLEALLLSEERLRLATQAAGLGLFDVRLGPQDFTIEWDDRMRSFWGLAPGQPVTYASALAGIHPDDRDALEAAIARARDPKGGGAYHASYRICPVGGAGVRHIDSVGQMMFAQGCPVRLIGMARDLSAQKHLEAELAEQRKELEALVNQQVAAHTAAAIAHEMNQPLIAISAYSEAALGMLDRGSGNPARLLHAVRGAFEQAQRAGGILRELFDFLHKAESPQELLDLNELVRGCVALADEGGLASLRTSLQLESGLPPVLANRLQIQKVVLNLLNNSIEAVRDSGIARSEVSITVRTNTDSPHLAQVTVQDNGPGLDKALADRVFEPFFSTKPQGVGLGLAISRALVEAHGGRLWAELDAGRGATFHFTLPFAPIP